MNWGHDYRYDILFDDHGRLLCERHRPKTGILINTMQTPANPNRLSRITRDPEICHGKPVIRGLRYPVQTILELLASGMTPEQILADYPDLEYEDILACLDYAASLIQVKAVQSLV